MKIVFRTIASHPNYEINRLAQVRNIKTGQILKPYDDGSGYLRVKLDGRSCRLHILVAETFIPNPDPENKTVVNHIHGNKHDCRASQLEWCTQAENVQHAWNTGLCGRAKKGCVNERKKF